MAEGRPLKLLFVCTANICRSPLALALFLHKASARGAAHRFIVDSAGTGDWYAGEPPDARVQQVAALRGVAMTSQARQVTQRDLRSFDYLICMDEDHRQQLLDLGAPPRRVHLLLEFDAQAPRREVPDPFCGDIDAFETVYGLVDSACDALLDHLLAASRAGA